MSGPNVSRMNRRLWLAGAASVAFARPAENVPVRLPRKVRVAVLGLDGHTGEILNPLPRLPDVEVVAVSDPKPAALAAARRRPALASARQYDDHRKMLEAEQVDVVGVCNPNGDRAAAILDCVRRGLHVVAEKPLALTRADLDRIKDEVKRQGVHLSMLLPMRYSPPYLAIKQIVEAGEIGEPIQLSSQKSYKAGDRPAWMRRRASFGGTIPWIGIHMIDLMRWTSGREFTEAFSMTAHVLFPQLGDMENVTASVFRLDNQGLAILRMDYLRPETAATHGDDRLRLAGAAGVVEYQASTGVTLITASAAERRITELPPARSLFIEFLESVYLGKPPSLTLADIYRVNEITIAAQEAAERGAVVRC